jgi:hypothetical protein
MCEHQSQSPSSDIPIHDQLIFTCPRSGQPQHEHHIRNWNTSNSKPQITYTINCMHAHRRLNWILMPTMCIGACQNRIACEANVRLWVWQSIVSTVHSGNWNKVFGVPVFLGLDSRFGARRLFPHTVFHGHSSHSIVSWITISTTWLSQYQSEYELYHLLQLGRYHQTQLHGVWLAEAYSRLYLLLQKTSPRHDCGDTSILFVHQRSVQIVYNTI